MRKLTKASDKLAGSRQSSVAAARGEPKHKTTTTWIITIFAIAFVLRLLYLYQIQSIPLFYHLAGDGRTYDEWAQRIAAGDWLGSGVFYQAPLYPYFLGLLQLFFGHNLWLIRVLQIVLGSLSCVLIFLIGQKLFSRGAGIAAGLFLAFYAPAIFFDALIEKSNLDVFLLTSLLVLLIGAMQRQHWSQWLTAGAVLGLLGLNRENALVLVVVVPFWIASYFSLQSLQTRATWTGLFLGGLLLILLPVGLRNFAVGGEFKLTTSQFGANFFIGNNPGADGTYGSVQRIIGEPQLEGNDAARLAERAAGRKMTPGEVSDFWLQKALSYIRAQPGEWFKLLTKKSLMVWNAREVEDSDDFYIYSRWSWLLTFVGWVNHFGVLAPVAAVGVWLTRGQWRRLWILYAIVVSFAGSVAVFYVFGRYRFPLVPLLALFAGAALAYLPILVRNRAWRSSMAVFAVLLLSALVVNWPIYGIRGPGSGGYNNLSNAYYKQGNVSEAINTARQALAVAPDRGVAYYNLGNLYAGQGRFDLAKQYFERAMEIYPNYADARSNYGQLVAERGDLETGIRYFREAIRLNPSIPRAHLNLGVALAKLGRIDDAIGPLQQAVRLSPDSPEASYYLGSVFAAQNRYAEAADYFYQSLRIQPDYVPAHQSLARLLVIQGKKEEARQHYQEAVRLMNLSRQTAPDLR
ncbi:MAG: tetratricopeptide repeat protein [Candidatus Binatia bacterium]